MPDSGGNGQEGAGGMHKRVQGRLQQLPLFARELLAGGAAGGLAKTCVAPLERTKIIFQTRGGQMTIAGVLRHMWQSEGLPGLFRGNNAAVVRIVPYAAIHFSAFEYIRRVIIDAAAARDGDGALRVSGGGQRDAPASLPVYDLLAGSASGAIAVMATYPLDLVRTRLAWATEATPATAAAASKQPLTAASHAHPGIWSTLRGTMAEEGLAGLYRGCAPTLLGILPYAGVKFYIYGAMKHRYRTWLKTQQQQQQQQQQEQQQAPQQQQHNHNPHHHHLPPAPPFETALELAQAAEAEADGQDEEQAAPPARSREQQATPQKLPVTVTLLFGGVAGLVAQTVTYPLDVIRRQMQVAHLQVAAAQTGGSSSGGSSGGNSATASGGSMQQQLRALSSSRPAAQQARAAQAAAEPSMVQVATKLWRQGGFFRGISLNFVKVIPSTAIGFTVYDKMKAYLDV